MPTIQQTTCVAEAVVSCSKGLVFICKLCIGIFWCQINSFIVHRFSLERYFGKKTILKHKFSNNETLS